MASFSSSTSLALIDRLIERSSNNEAIQHCRHILTQLPKCVEAYRLLGKALLMGVLVCSFLAFDVPFSAGTIVGGFSIGYLFLIVSPTPSGIGVVEGVMALALASLRVVWSQAVIVTLVYRAITFWVPLGVGALAFRKLH